MAATFAGVLYFSGQPSPSMGKWILGLLLVVSGATLAIGLLTTFAGLALGLSCLGIALSWFAVPSPAWHEERMDAFGVAITAIAISLLGPGAYSLDGRLFGRREIVIPPSSGSRES